MFVDADYLRRFRKTVLEKFMFDIESCPTIAECLTGDENWQELKEKILNGE